MLLAVAGATPLAGHTPFGGHLLGVAMNYVPLAAYAISLYPADRLETEPPAPRT